ncbi:SH3 domain-binding glutamic acid-rich-like protein 3 [Hemiscyllium ocellatum]|uniref:SH3 domain-binding glutamic acid-rich-like protein 3 n=1 Tax=Hemiscyllium ocellatum TaxID=170820 RepID=UPI0029675B48|nr:SH3 domain-binding glutamic acid-rich-like protein 3 [Hemiscyllium ocellatum]
MVITIYYASITATAELESQQNTIFNTLNCLNIKYQLLDLSAGQGLLDKMRAKMGSESARPPQIFNGDQYCGGYEAFFEAVEAKKVKEFLKLETCQNQSQKD